MLRSLVKDVVVYGLGIAATRLVGFFMIPIYTRVLTPADYGVLDAVSRLVDVINLLLALGIAHAVLRYYNEPADEAGRRRLVSTALIMIFAMTLVGFLLFIPTSTLLTELLFGNTEHEILVRVGLGGMLLGNLVILPLTIFRAAGRAWRFTFISILQFVTLVALNLLLVVAMRLGVLGALLSGLLSNLVWGFGLTISLVSEVGLSFDHPFARRLLSYGIPLVPASIAAFILHSSDRFFLVRLAPLEELGLYSLAYRFALLVSTFSGFVGKAWWPWAFGVDKNPDKSRLLRDAGALILVATAAVCAGVILFSGPVIRILAAERFWPAEQYVPILAIAYWFFATGAPFTLGARLAERTGLIAVANAVAAVVTIVLSFLLIPALGAWGATWVTLVGFATRSLAELYVSQLVLPQEQLWGSIGWSLVALAIAAVANRWADFPMPVDLALRSLLWLVIFFGLLGYYLYATGRSGFIRHWLGQVAQSAAAYFGV